MFRRWLLRRLAAKCGLRPRATFPCRSAHHPDSYHHQFENLETRLAPAHAGSHVANVGIFQPLETGSALLADQLKSGHFGPTQTPERPAVVAPPNETHHSSGNGASTGVGQGGAERHVAPPIYVSPGIDGTGNRTPTPEERDASLVHYAGSSQAAVPDNSVSPQAKQKPLLSVEATRPQAVEAPGDQAESGEFTIRREGNLQTIVFAHFTIDGTASFGRDYDLWQSDGSPVTLHGDAPPYLGTLMLAPGQAQAVIHVQPIDDAEPDNNEVVRLTLEDEAKYRVDPDRRSAVVTITNNEQPVAFNLDFGTSHRNTVVVGGMVGSDPDGDPITFSLEGVPLPEMFAGLAA